MNKYTADILNIVQKLEPISPDEIITELMHVNMGISQIDTRSEILRLVNDGKLILTRDWLITHAKQS